jgi:hypothetical protein
MGWMVAVVGWEIWPVYLCSEQSIRQLPIGTRTRGSWAECTVNEAGKSYTFLSQEPTVDIITLNETWRLSKEPPL